MIENVLKQLKEDKEDELKNKLRSLAAKNLFKRIVLKKEQKSKKINERNRCI